MAKDKRPGDPPVVTSGYDEPSLIFLLGTRTRIARPAEAAEIAARNGGLALIGRKEDALFRTRLLELGASARAVDHLSGINYSHGRPVAITPGLSPCEPLSVPNTAATFVYPFRFA